MVNFYSIATGYTVRGGISKPTYLNNVHCVENELTLMDCNYESINDTNKYDHSKDVAIKCTQGTCKCSYNVNDYNNYC